MYIQNLISILRRYASALWMRYRGLSKRLQIVVGIVVVALVLMVGYKLTHGGSTATGEVTLPSVTIAAVNTLSGNGGAYMVIGAVRSVTEASILAQSGGTVTSINADLGQYVPLGYVIAELDNASQRAAVLQAEGSYEAALSAQSGTSPTDIAATARNAYMTAYSSVDTLLKTDIDTFFGEPGGQGPALLISPVPFDFPYFPARRQALTDAMSSWRDHLATVSTTDPKTLLDEADTIVHQATALGNDLALSATRNGSDASAAQVAALAAARTGFAAVQASITAAKTSYQGQSTSASTGASASVKIALGGLRAAQAQLEKTLVRAPISGSINFLPIHVGDYVATLTHVATVAQNGTLEIVANISEDNRASLSVGDKVIVEDIYPAVITSISPALDPVTKQIEIHVSLTGKAPLLSGQSVRISLSSSPVMVKSTGPQLLPLTALKLTPSARVVFSVGEDGRLVAHPVTIGLVEGDRIEITTPLPDDLMIVTDARGFSEGQKVTVVSPQ